MSSLNESRHNLRGQSKPANRVFIDKSGTCSVSNMRFLAGIRSAKQTLTLGRLSRKMLEAILEPCPPHDVPSTSGGSKHHLRRVMEVEQAVRIRGKSKCERAIRKQ